MTVQGCQRWDSNEDWYKNPYIFNECYEVSHLGFFNIKLFPSFLGKYSFFPVLLQISKYCISVKRWIQTKLHLQYLHFDIHIVSYTSLYNLNNRRISESLTNPSYAYVLFHCNYLQGKYCLRTWKFDQHFGFTMFKELSPHICSDKATFLSQWWRERSIVRVSVCWNQHHDWFECQMYRNIVPGARKKRRREAQGIIYLFNFVLTICNVRPNGHQGISLKHNLTTFLGFNRSGRTCHYYLLALWQLFKGRMRCLHKNSTNQVWFETSCAISFPPKNGHKWERSETSEKGQFQGEVSFNYIFNDLILPSVPTSALFSNEFIEKVTFHFPTWLRPWFFLSKHLIKLWIVCAQSLFDIC